MSRTKVQKKRKKEIFPQEVRRRCNLSIVLKASHPFGPVARLDLAGEGVWTARVEIPMPIERPEFLEPDFSDGPVQKHAVDRRSVPVQTDPPHLIAAREVFRRAVVEWRLIIVERPDVVPETIEKDRYPICGSNVDVSVVVARVAARGSIAQPLIEAIAAV